MNITYTTWDSSSNKKTGEIGRIEKDRENKIWRAFEKGTASSLCCGKPARLPPCLRCGNRDVDSIESVAGKGLESKSLGPVPQTMLSHPENYCWQINHCTKGKFWSLPWQIMALTNQEELGWNIAQSLESDNPLVFFRERGHIMHREISHDSYQILLDTASSLSHSESLPWSCHEAFWVLSDSRPHPHGISEFLFPKL